jgi:hypothetical protein
MNDLKMLRELLGNETTPTQLGVVSEVLDTERIVVLLDSGVYRRIAGAAPIGARVTVRGEQLHGQVGQTVTTYVL